MKRYTDDEIDVMHETAVDLANENSKSGSVASICVSNIIIIELFKRLLEK